MERWREIKREEKQEEEGRESTFIMTLWVEYCLTYRI